MVAAIFLKNAHSLKAANFRETWQKTQEVEQTLLPRDSIDGYLIAQIATPHSSTKNFEIQAKRDLLEFLNVNDFTNRDYLSKWVKMSPRTFRSNMKTLKEGGPLERKKGSGGPLQSSVNEKKRLCQIALKSQLASTENVCHCYNKLAGISVSKSTVFLSSEIVQRAQINCKIHPETHNGAGSKKGIEFCRTWNNFNFGET